MNNHEEQEVDIGELVSFRQEEPELGEEGINTYNLFCDQSMGKNAHVRNFCKLENSSFSARRF